MMSGQPSLRVQTAFTFLGKAAAYGMQIVTPVILVRIMDQEQFGSYRQILFLGAVVGELMRAALPQGIYYFFPQGVAPRVLLGQTLCLMTVSGAVIGFAFVVVCGGLGWLPSGLTRDLVPLLLIVYFLESFSFILEPLFIVEQRPLYVLVSSVAGAVLLLVSVVGAMLVFGTIRGVVYGLLIFNCLRATGLLVYLAKRYRVRPGFHDRGLLLRQLGYTLPLAGGAIVGMAGAQIDKAVISGLMSPQDFAVYSLGGLSVISAITLFSNSMGNVCLPRLSALGARGDREAVRQLWHKIVVMNAVLLIPTVCFCFVFARPIITVLYTDKYVDSADILRINLLAPLMQLLDYGRVLSGLGRTRSILLGNVCRTVTGLVLVFGMVQWFGMRGAAWSFVIAYWVNGLVQLNASRRLLPAGLSGFLPWGRLALIAAVSAAVVLALAAVTTAGSAPDLAILAMAPVYLLAVGAILQALGCVDLVGSVRGIFARA